MHFCANVTCGGGMACLLRAIEPLEGLDEQRALRHARRSHASSPLDSTEIGSGPARLCQARARAGRGPRACSSDGLDSTPRLMLPAAGPVHRPRPEWRRPVRPGRRGLSRERPFGRRGRHQHVAPHWHRQRRHLARQARVGKRGGSGGLCAASRRLAAPAHPGQAAAVLRARQPARERPAPGAALECGPARGPRRVKREKRENGAPFVT